MRYITKLNQAKLKVKAKSLAEEAKIIRREEQKMLKNHQKYHDHTKCDRWNIGECDWYGSLHWHRTWDVRQEARATHLARAFLMGKDYSTVEAKTNDPYALQVALSRAATIAFKYGDSELHLKYRDRINAACQGIPIPDRNDPDFNRQHQKHQQKINAKQFTEKVKILREWADFDPDWWKQN